MMIRTLLLSLFSFLLTCTATFASTPIASEGDDAYRLGLKYNKAAVQKGQGYKVVQMVPPTLKLLRVLGVLKSSSR